MNNNCMLTTVDNPYNPFEEFAKWLLFDIEKGYNTCEHLARIVQITSDMSQKEIEEEETRAIDQIIEDDFLNIYVKVFENEPETVET